MNAIIKEDRDRLHDDLKRRADRGVDFTVQKKRELGGVPGSKLPTATPLNAENVVPPVTGEGGAAPVLIGCYNYKGGVGKTTVAINLGYALRQLGHRTCYVDCDAQCDLTTFFNRLSQPQAQVQRAEEAGRDDAYAAAPGRDLGISWGDAHTRGDLAAAPPHVSIGRARLSTYFVGNDADGGLSDVSQPELLAGAGPGPWVTIRNVLTDVFSLKPTPTRIMELAREGGPARCARVPDGLFLVPGDKSLHAMVEGRVQSAMGNMFMRYQQDAFMALGGFRKALHDIARAHDIKYFVCDFGPSAGIMNQVLVGSCDYIVPPFQPDVFSASSVQGLLCTLLPSVLSKHASIKEQEAKHVRGNSPYTPFAFNPSPPRLLPFLMMGFRANGNVVDKADAKFFGMVMKTVEDRNVPKKVQDLYERDGNYQMVIPFLRHVPTVFRSAQEQGCPAMGLDEPAIGSMCDELEAVKLAFRQLAALVVDVSKGPGSAELTRTK
eukprot:jgi/Mesvir1/1712/Mv21168-RA.1